jgi:polyhydroxyalkanoate synthesis regulator phasin
MSYVHEMIREGWEKTDQAYEAEKHAQLLGALAGLLAPHLNELIDARVKRAINDLNDRDADNVRALVREELENQADDFENRVNEIIDEREFIDQDSLDEKIEEKIDETLRERELVRKDELEDKIAEVLGTFAEGDTMREKIQDALDDMSGSFTLSRY